MAYGQSGHLAISFQNSFGTSFTDSPIYVPLVSESIAETINQLVENNMYARLAESPTHEGIHEIAGDIVTDAHPVALGAFLKAALGSTSTTAQDSAFLHEFLPASTDWDAFAAVPPMTVEVFRDAGSAFIYHDMLGTALTLEIAQGQLLSASMGMLGGQFSQSAKSAVDFKAGRPWSWDVVSASYDGGALADLRQISLVFDNQLATHFTLSGGRFPHRIKRSGPQTVALEGTMLFQDQAQFLEYQGQSEKQLLIHLGGQTVAESYQTELTVDVPRLRFTEFAPQLNGAGQLEVNFSGKGVFDAGSGYAMRVTLTNTMAGY